MEAGWGWLDIGERQKTKGTKKHRHPHTLNGREGKREGERKGGNQTLLELMDSICDLISSSLFSNCLRQVCLCRLYPLRCEEELCQRTPSECPLLCVFVFLCFYLCFCTLACILHE